MTAGVGTVPPYLFAQEGDFDAPYTFTVPATLEVQPYSATATFDGTNAGGAFLACLSFYSSSGNLLARVFPSTQVAAGDVAQVSYAPFPGGLINSASGQALETTDGSTDVNPTTKLFIGAGLTLTAPSPGEAQIDGGAGGMVRLYAYTLPVAQTTIDTAVDGPDAGLFPQTFSVLEVWLNARSDNAFSIQSLVGFTFNGDTGNNYDLQQVQGIAGVVSASSVHNSAFFGGDLSGDSAAAGALRPGVARFSVADYAGTVFHKAVEMTGGALGTGTGRADFTTAVWHPTSVQGITSLAARALGGDKWKAGSSLFVYARS